MQTNRERYYMYTIFIESEMIESLEFKDPDGNPVLRLNVVKPGVDEVPISAIYIATREEMQVLAFLINQKHGDSVQVKQASDIHNATAIGEINLVGKFMNGDVLADERVLFKAIEDWQNAGKTKVSLCFFNPVSLTYPDGMEHLIHTTVLTVVNTIRSVNIEVEYEIIAPLNVVGVYDKVREHFGENIKVSPIPVSLASIKQFDGVWDLSTITPIDNSSEIVLDFMGVPKTNIKEKTNDRVNEKCDKSMQEDIAKSPIGIWAKIWSQILRLFGIRL